MKTVQIKDKDAKRKKLNRRSKLFYVSCDYINVNDDTSLVDGSKQSGLILNVQSDPINIIVDQNSEVSKRERKKRNRKSKLFYVSCEHFDIEQIEKQVNDSCSVSSLDYSDGDTYNSPYINSKYCKQKPLSLSHSSLDTVSLPSSIAYSSSECTPVNRSSPSSGHLSGRLTPLVKKRPKRPNIQLSNHRPYKDYVEIRRTESLSSFNSECADSVTSENSYFDISEDVIANAVLSSQFQSVPGAQFGDALHEFEETLHNDNVIPKQQIEIKSGDIEELCKRRSESPTSKFLSPLLSCEQDAIMMELHCQLSPMLHKMKKLEEQSKKLSSLQVKLAVLQEEKRQLTTMLKHKRHPDSNMSSDNETETKNRQLKSKNICQTPLEPSKENETLTGNSSLQKQFKDASVQKYLEFVTEISHKHTSTDDMNKDCSLSKSSMVGASVASLCDTGIGDNIADILSYNIGTQSIESKNEDRSTQCFVECVNQASSVGCSVSNLKSELIQCSVKTLDFSCGMGLANIKTSDASNYFAPMLSDLSVNTDCIKTMETSVSCDIQKESCTIGVGEDKTTDVVCDKCFKYEKKDQSTECVVKQVNQFSSVGCSVSDLKNGFTQCSVKTLDFSCGTGLAEIVTSDASNYFAPMLSDLSVNTDCIKTVETSVSCDIQKESCTIGVSEDKTTDIVCDLCLNKKSCSIGAGAYIDQSPCCIDDKLCDCVKPLCESIGIGDTTINNICCDKCESLIVTSVAVGDDRIDDLLCDKCTNIKTTTLAVGEGTIDDLLCDKCSNKSLCVDRAIGEDCINDLLCDACSNKQVKSIGVGEDNINETSCEKCKTSNDNILNFDMNILNAPAHPPPQQAVLCHYCGNKVDLNDSHLEDSLQAMRESMKSVSSGMKRSTVLKNLNLDLESDSNASYNRLHVKEGSLDSPDSDEYHGVISDDEEEGTSGRNDVIEACKMLHNHFSGDKPLKQQQMMKYMSIIQALWFKTLKRRRANAAVVKSYIDLFQQRIPELLETVMNLADDEGNTGLHYALTYKNYSVASILLDSGECCVDLVNQAGYSPIMLAALAGFERKNDKYIMQRLLRLGDINKEAADTGQTPLMLAVSRGNLGVVELLLDAGCDINALDDEGSTALMGACEHGNINIVKALLVNPDCDATIEDNEGSTALSIAMDARRKDLALLIYGSLNFDARGRIKLSPSKQSLLGLGRRSPSPVIGRT